MASTLTISVGVGTRGGAVTVSDGVAISKAASLIALADWVSRYYCTPLGMTLSAMTPGAVKLGVGVRKRVEIEPTGGALPADLKVTPTLRAAIEAIARVRGIASVLTPAGIEPAPDLEELTHRRHI